MPAAYETVLRNPTASEKRYTYLPGHIAKVAAGASVTVAGDIYVLL